MSDVTRAIASEMSSRLVTDQNLACGVCESVFPTKRVAIRQIGGCQQADHQSTQQCVLGICRTQDPRAMWQQQAAASTQNLSWMRQPPRKTISSLASLRYAGVHLFSVMF